MFIFHYLSGIAQTLRRFGAAWWFSLILAYVFGADFWTNYPKYRDQIDSWIGAQIMPRETAIWMILVPIGLWLLVRLVHEEAMRYLRAARLIFDQPFVDRMVPIVANWDEPEEVPVKNSTKTVIVSKPQSRQKTSNDMVKIVVRNCPRDTISGRPVIDAHAYVRIFDRVNQNLVKEFPFPRWEENPKPFWDTPSGRVTVIAPQ